MLAVRMISIFICSYNIVYELMHICILNNGYYNKKNALEVQGRSNKNLLTPSIGLIILRDFLSFVKFSCIFMNMQMR